MNYTAYSLDRLMDFKNYKEICDRFLELAIDEETKEKLESILYKGGYKNYDPYGGEGRNNPYIDIQRRMGLAYLIIKNPDTFDKLVDNNIMYFHGTRVDALPGILKYGLNCVDKIKEHGEEVLTGEEWSRYDGNREFISFTDVLDIAESYSSLSPKNKTELSFPIVIGTTKEKISDAHMMHIQSSVPEIGVRGEFPKESISCILVPSSKIDIVKKMAGDIMVLPIDDVQNRFYWANPDGYELVVIEEKYNNLKEDIKSKEDELKGIKESVLGRTFTKIKQEVNKLMEFVKGDEVYERRATR